VLGLGATAIAAPQLVPTALILPWSHRSEAPERFEFGSMWLTNPERLFIAGTGVLNNIPSFLGFATLLAGACAVIGRRPGAAMLLAIAVVAFLAALGPQVGLYGLLHRVPPFSYFRNPVKAYAVTEFATIWLAALGVDVLWRLRTGAGRAAAALLVAGMLLEHGVYLPQEIAAIDALRKGDGLQPERYERLQELAMLQRGDSEVPPPVTFDAGGPSGGGFARSLGALLGISSIHAGTVALLSPAHMELLDRPSPEMLDVFGARYVLSPADKCDYLTRRFRWTTVARGEADCVLENPRPTGRYVVLDDAVAVDSRETMLTRARETPRPVPIVASSDVALAKGRGTLAVTQYRPGHAVLAVNAAGPVLVLVRESFAPGWTARVDGRTVAPYPAAGIFFAVPVDAGVHRVEIDYRAPGLQLGTLVGAVWIAGATIVWWARTRARSPGPRPLAHARSVR